MTSPAPIPGDARRYSRITGTGSHLPPRRLANADMVRELNLLFGDGRAIDELRDIVKKSGLVFALTHNYTGYPMVKEARRMVKDGELGRFLSEGSTGADDKILQFDRITVS